MLLNTLLSKIRLQIHVSREVSRKRRDIRRLSDHLLDDIGMTHFHAKRVVNSPFWDMQENSEPPSEHPVNTEGTDQTKMCPHFKGVKYS
jgi:uncharacterized protein YjiS (DUF1127 family)